MPIILKGGGADPSCPAYYADNFSDPGSGWLIHDDGVYRYAYTGGQYQIWVKDQSYLIEYNPWCQSDRFYGSGQRSPDQRQQRRIWHPVRYQRGLEPILRVLC